MRVAVVGCGYVGLVTGVCLAAKGHDVTCVDIDRGIVARLNAGEPHIYEAGLAELLVKTRSAGRFSATTDLPAALAGAAIVLLAVGTPSRDSAIDLSQVRAAARDIGMWLRDHGDFLAVAVKSTVVPGTTDTVVRAELEAASGKRLGDFGLGMNPEFLREGEAVADFMQPDRIVLGHDDPRTLALLEELYAPWDCDKLTVNSRTAELIKYANNALLALQISAVNELANLATALGGIDVLDVLKGVHLDRRWSPIVDGKRISPGILSFLLPGPGFGGSCFPKDLQALRAEGRRLGLPMRMVDAVLAVNEAQPGQVVAVLDRAFPSLAGKRVLLLGLAFKPGTDDVRESASFAIVELLLERGARLSVHDPMAAGNFRRELKAKAATVLFVQNWRNEVASTEIIVVATKWPAYQALAEMDLVGKTVLDARRMIAPDGLKQARYMAIGRGPI